MPRPNKVSWFQPKRGAGRWRFSKVGADGKRHYHYAPAEYPQTDGGRRKATAWMDAKLKELEARVVTGDDWCLDDLRLAYITWVKRQVADGKLEPVTLKGHSKHLKMICRRPRGGSTFGAVLARELSAKILGELVRTWSAAGRSPTTIRNRIGSLQAMLNWAASARDDRPIERLIPGNPVAGYELPKAEYQGDRYAPAEEVAAFLAWVDQQAAAATGVDARFERLVALLIRVAAETGCRPGELCKLTWAHYLPEKRTFILKPREHKTGKKTRKPRFILVSPELGRRLEELRTDPHRHPDYLFTHRVHTPLRERTDEERLQGDPWNSNALSRRIKELRRRAIKAKVLTEDSGVKRMHLYRLRHTSITNAIQGGMSVADVAALHGNSPKMVADVYLHVQVEHLLNVRDRFDAGPAEGGEKPADGAKPQPEAPADAPGPDGADAPPGPA